MLFSDDGDQNGFKIAVHTESSGVDRQVVKRKCESKCSKRKQGAIFLPR